MQNFGQFESFMYLSPEADELIIMNRKPNENQPYDEAGMINPEQLAYE